jgi:hypothetical protein
MKNIHLISTDKPSRLWTNNLKRRLELDEFPSQHPTNIAKNIYITSDVEIKTLEYEIYYDKVLKKVGNAKSYGKKIILTTDQDLIKDGVQSIDDEFLEWFVKNPSCESVEVERLEDGQYVDYLEDNSVIEGIYENYKIIIPKEEPKQETEQMNVGGGSGSLPERKAELLQTLKKLQQENKITDEKFQKGYYNGFEDGCNAMIEFLSGNGA